MPAAATTRDTPHATLTTVPSVAALAALTSTDPALASTIPSATFATA